MGRLSARQQSTPFRTFPHCDLILKTGQFCSRFSAHYVFDQSHIYCFSPSPKRQCTTCWVPKRRRRIVLDYRNVSDFEVAEECPDYRAT